MPPQDEARARAMRNTSVAGAIVNTILCLLKIIFGLITQSHALIADGIHSLADLSTDAMVWVAARFTAKPADKDHPYGHARIETAFTVILAIILGLTALGIAMDAGQRLLSADTLLHPTPLAMGIAAISIVANEGLYHYTMAAAKRFKSGLLHANAWHHRSDAISSVVVLLGVAGSLIGFVYLDAIASIVVAVMIARIGWEQGKHAMLELIDTALEPRKVRTIRNIINDVEGVRDIHMLRTRRMGGNALVDVHVEVKPRISVSEGHQISEFVRMKLINSITEVTDVTVHIDPEDDSKYAANLALPLRREVIRDLTAAWKELVDTRYLSTSNLHYLARQIQVDLLLPFEHFESTTAAHELTEQLTEAAAHLPYLSEVRVYYGEPVKLTET